MLCKNLTDMTCCMVHSNVQGLSLYISIYTSPYISDEFAVWTNLLHGSNLLQGDRFVLEHSCKIHATFGFKLAAGTNLLG